MLNQLNSTTKRELDAKYLSEASAEEIEEDVSDLQETVSGIQSDLGEVSTAVTTLTNRVNTYLDTEQEVGRFGDDKLYQITINCGALPNNTTKYVATEISASQIISMEGVAITDPAGDDKAICLPLPFVGGSGTYIGLYVHILSTDYISLRLTTDADRSAYTGYVTLQYTKPAEPEPEPEPEPSPDPDDSNNSNDSNEPSEPSEPTEPSNP